MRNHSQKFSWAPIFILFIVLFGLAFVRVHLRVRTTLIGYEIGKLKTKEAKLLANRSQLRMLHAKLTTKEQLETLAKE